MACLRCRRGFTLIEVLIMLLVSLLIVDIGIGIFKVMVQSPHYEVSQIEIFDVQIRQLIIRSGRVAVEDDQLYIDYRNEQFEIYQDGTRLVKRPGYEILLEDVSFFNGYEVCQNEVCIEIKKR